MFILHLFNLLGIEEIYSLFTHMHVFGARNYHIQAGCKFLKLINNDNFVEFKSKWKYSFNTTQKTRDLIVGIHQNQFLTAGFSSPFFVGFVVLKSSAGNYTYIDHLYLIDNYNSYLQLKLDIGSYMIIPM